MRWADKIAQGGRDHPRYSGIRAMLNAWRKGEDNIGILRHNAGQPDLGLLHYMPQTPSRGLEKVRSKIYTFNSRADVVTNTVNANEYVWKEGSSGSGTPLAVIDVVGGGCQFINGAVDNNYYYYESDAEFCELSMGKDLWFRIYLQISDATQSDFFAGVCARLASGNLFDNRVDAVGFHSEDGDTNIDFQARNVTGSGDALAQGTLVNNTDIILGFHWNASANQVEFWIDDTYVTRINDFLYFPTTEMCVSFGMRMARRLQRP